MITFLFSWSVADLTTRQISLKRRNGTRRQQTARHTPYQLRVVKTYRWPMLVRLLRRQQIHTLL